MQLISKIFSAFAAQEVPQRKRQRRTCRIEELESREMLSVSPWNAFSYTEPEFSDGVEEYRAEAVWEFGDVTVKGDAEVYVDSYGNALIGSKNYSITFSVGGTYEAFLTGLTEREVSSIIAGVFDVNPFDAEKTGYGDSSLCWAGATSNMLAYTGWGDVNGFQTADDIFAYFNTNFTNTGGWMDRGCEWFITGKYAGTYNSAQLINADSGGFYSVDDGNAVSSLKVANNVSKVTGMVDQLQNGSAVALALSYTGLSASHAVTLWGVVYDTSLSPTDPNYYKALIITDSDDNYGSGANAPNRLKCISIECSESGWYFLTSSYGRSNCYLYGYTALAARPGYDANTHVTTDTVIDIYFRDVPPTSVSPDPVKVSNFQATADNTNIVLTWDAVDGTASYRLEYSTDGANWTSIYEGIGTSYTHEDIAPYTVYQYRMSAVNTDGECVNSEALKVFPSGTGVAPKKVGGVKKTNVTLTTATISWKPHVKNTAYEIRCLSHPGVHIGEITLVNGRLTVEVTGLTPRKVSHTFSIASYNGEGDTKVKTVVVKTKNYTAVKGIWVPKEEKTTTNIMLTWDPSEFPETTGYVVFCYDTLGSIRKTETVIMTNVMFTGLDPNTKYKFEIYAVSDLLGGFESKVAKISVRTLKLPK